MDDGSWGLSSAEGASVKQRPEAYGTRGMVASAHPVAAFIGLSILQRGGNAFDAAIAVAAAEGVVLPMKCGLGGDAFVVLHDGALACEYYRTPEVASTPHPLLSVTKSVVGCLAGVLIADGRLDPDAPASGYLPELARGGYGGLLGVGMGSSRPPRLVRLEYAPDGAAVHLALVGKGITFDSGGLSIKPAAGMEAMKSDMSGAAAVLHAVVAAARLGLPVRLSGWLALAENMPSATAQRPSDVITIHGGKTVEVLNTDAEGRLVLADALVAASATHPDLIVDVATLTGAQMVALGNRTSAIMANDDALRERVHRVSAETGEQFWPMPLPPELRSSMDSPVADIANIGDRFGGMLVAGLFLSEFVGTRGGAAGGRRGARTGSIDEAAEADDAADGPIPWAHLDIAGPAFNTGKAFGYTPVGGTGVCVRTLVRLAEDIAAAGA